MNDHWRKKILGLSCVWLFALAAHATVNEDIQHEFYSVAVNHGETLKQAINRTSPITHEGNIFHAHTRWQVEWRGTWHAVRENNCGITDIEVDVKTLMRLPRLTQGSAAQQQQFDIYHSKLVNHELGHHEIGRKAAFAIEKYLLSKPRAQDCASLQVKLDKKVADIIQQHSAQDIAYDKKTRHGETQGAYLKEDI